MRLERAPAPIDRGPVSAALLVSCLLLFLVAGSGALAGFPGNPETSGLTATRDSLMELGLFAEALPVAEKIRGDRLALRPTNQSAVAEATIPLARIHAELSHLDTADSLVGTILDMSWGTGARDSTTVADALAVRSFARALQGQVDDAIAVAEEVLAIRIRYLGTGHRETAQARIDLADLLGNARRFDEANEMIGLALESFEGRALSRGDSLTMAQGMIYRGYYASQPANSEGELLLQRAHAIQTAVLGPVSAAASETLNILGILLLGRGDFDGALQVFEESLAIRRRLFDEDHRLVRQSRNNCAVVLNELERFEESEPVFREVLALAIAELGPDHPSHTYFYHNIGFSLHGQERYGEAWEAYEQAIDLRTRTMGEDDRLVTRSKHHLATIAQDRGDYADAERRYLEVLKCYEDDSGFYGRNKVAAMASLGQTVAARGDLEAGAAWTRQAVEVYEWLRIRSFGARHRATFMRAPYDQLAVLNVALGDEEAAWNAVVRASGMTLAELLRTSDRRRLTDSELAREDSLAADLADAEALLLTAKRSAAETESADAERGVQSARRDVLAAESRWQEFRGDMAARYPVTEGRQATLAEVQAQLDDRTALIGWVDARLPADQNGSWGYVVRHEGPVVWQPLEPGAGSGEATTEFRDLILEQAPLVTFLAQADRDRLTDAAHRVWRERLAPLEPHLAGVTDLVCVPSPVMADVPMAALVDAGGEFVGDRFVLSETPSISSFAWLRSQRGPRDEVLAALLVGDPPFRPEHLAEPAGGPSRPDEQTMEIALLRNAVAGDPESLARLPRLRYAEREMAGVAELFPTSMILSGPAATEDTLMAMAAADELAGYDVLHFATHALVDELQPNRSALALSQVDDSGVESARPGLDGLVSGAEIIRQWRLDADLVTLSACQTALGRRTHEGTMGLATAFLEAGAGCLLVSLWNVDDEATSQLVQHFYANWRGGMSKADALREARRRLRIARSLGGASWDHPFYWSAFVLVGNPD